MRQVCSDSATQFFAEFAEEDQSLCIGGGSCGVGHGVEIGQEPEKAEKVEVILSAHEVLTDASLAI